MSGSNYNISSAPPVSAAWTDFTPTGSWTTNTTYEGKYRLLDEITLECTIKISMSGSPGTTALLSVNLPSGFEIDRSSFPYTGALPGRDIVGRGSFRNASPVYNYRARALLSGDITENSFLYIAQNGNASNISILSYNVPISFASGDNIRVNFIVPVVRVV